MDDSIKTPLKECIDILNDRKWHDVYELHMIYKLDALEIFRVVEILLANGLIDKSGYRIKLIEELDNVHFALLNRMQKTKRPSSISAFEPHPLTSKKKRV